MSYSLTDYSATEVELNDGLRSYYYKKCYCSVELQGEYIIFTSHKVENNAFRQQWSIAYTDFTTPTGSAATVLAAIKTIIENYAGGGTTGVTNVTATSPITSSGGTTPNISTQVNKNKLIGRNPTTAGVMEEISIGSGLSLSGTTLSASVSGSITHATASGTDTYSATITGVTGYADGDVYLIRFTNGNTTSSTININSLGAVSLYRNNDGPIIGGDIQAGSEMLLVYNATSSAFQCIGTSPNTIIAYVTNADSVTINKGQPVYAYGGTGDRMTVKLAYNTSDATSAQTVGLVLSTSIATNQKGFIMLQGLLDGLSIVKPSDGWADGDAVFLGATAGTITRTKQYAPNHLVYLGFVTTASNGAAGRMYVRVQNGYELDELHNVQARTPSNNDTIYFDSADSQWKTASLATIIGTASATTTGLLSSTDWTTFNSKGSGTVTSVAALTLGTSGTNLNSTVANGTTTPVITLNVPDASASARGVVTTGTQTLAGAKTLSSLASFSAGVNVTPPTGSGSTVAGVIVSGSNTNGGTNYNDFLKATNSAVGATNINKWFRLNSTGGLEIVNSAYSSTILTLTDTGTLNGATQAEMGYLSGVTSNIQTQLNSKAVSALAYRKSGRWYNNGIFPPANGSFTNQINIRYVPIILDADITITRLGLNVTTAAAAGNTARIGIYSNDAATTQPLNLLVDSGTYGTLALDTTGAKSVTGLSLSLTRGLYWMAYTASITSGTITGIGTNFMYDVKGQASISGVGWAGFNQTATYGALPSTAGTLADTGGTGTVCLFYYF